MNKILTCNMTAMFVNTLIKSELLKRQLKLEESPILFVIISEENELSDYMKSIGYTKEGLKDKYKIKINSIINLHNNLSNNDINKLFSEYLNKEYLKNRMNDGYVLTCEDILFNEIKREV